MHRRRITRIGPFALALSTACLCTKGQITDVANGTFVGTDNSGISYSGTIKQGEIEMSTDGLVTLSAFYCASLPQNSTYFTFTSPPGVTMSNLDCQITLPSAATGTYTQADSQGDLLITASTQMTTGTAYTEGDFYASTPGVLDVDGGAGNWSINIATMTRQTGYDPKGGNPQYYYSLTGSLNATLSSWDGGTGTLSVTF